MTFTVRTAASGGWLAFTSSSRLLLVSAPDDDFIEACWAGIRADDGYQNSLDLLTRKGLAATPPFVLVEWSPGATARVIVRGEATMSVTDAAGTQLLDATGVSTWVERSLPGVTGLSFEVPGAAPAGTAALPLESGVAYVAAISTLAGPTAAGTVEPTPVGTVEPTPVGTVETQKAEPVVPTPAVEIDIEATRRGTDDLISSPPPAASEPDDGGYDYLFGETVHRSVADAAVREPDPEEDGDEAVVDDELHDGETVMTSDIAKLRGKRRPKATAAATPTAPQKLVLVLPTGAREPLVQPVLIGRSPSVSKISGGQIPRLIAIGSADQDISRNHAQFALEGGTVVVTDLHSRNGTSIVLPGKSPQKLRAGEPTSVIVGTVVDFGGGITITVEDEA